MDKFNRLTLINQFEILKALNPGVLQLNWNIFALCLGIKLFFCQIFSILYSYFLRTLW